MASYDGDEPDGLVQASFTIASSSKGSRDNASPSTFPILAKYENNRRPSELRKSGFSRARRAMKKSFKDTIEGIFDPIIADIDAHLVSQACPFFIPGCSTSAATSRRLPAHALIGPQISHHFESKLKSRAKGRSNVRWVTLLPRECPSLAATIQLLVARCTGDTAASSSCRDAASLSALSSLPPSSVVAIHVRSLALHRYNLINDLIKSLQSASQAGGYPRLVLLFDVDGGGQALSNKLDPDSLRLMDMTRVVLPAPARAFEEFVNHLFLDESSAHIPRLGPRVVELLQYEFFERGFDLDKTFASIELALHHHFTTRPLSVMSCLDLPSDFISEDWTTVFFDKLRLQIIQTDGEGNISLPRPQDEAAASKGAYLHDILTDDDLVIQAVKVDYSAVVSEYRAKLSKAIKLLHALRSHFLIQATGGDEDAALPGPRRSTLGGLATFVMSGNGMRSLVSSAVAALRKAPLARVEACLKSVEESNWATDETFRSRLYLAIGKVRYEIQQAKEEGEEERIGEEAANLSAKDRVEMVQKRLLREESSESAKRSIAEWCASTIDSWTSVRPLLSQVFTYDFTAYLTQLIDPNPRADMLAAMHKPSKVLQGLSDGMTSSTPDICRLYQLYQSAGRMINLSDWFQAFSQSVESSGKTPTRKRKRKGRGGVDDGSLGDKNGNNNDDDDDDERQDLVRARFALAVNELGRMGFLKRTRRKAEHVLKIVHDLPATEG